MKRALILIGLKACGKTSVGGLLAEALNVMFIDTDQCVESLFRVKTGAVLDCAGIVRAEGLAYFRALEKEVVANLSLSSPCVIATGGGVVLDEQNRHVLRDLGTVIYLAVSYATWLSRLKASPQPAFMDAATDTHGVFLQREPLYRALSNQIYHADGVSVAQIVGQLSQIGIGGHDGK